MKLLIKFPTRGRPRRSLNTLRKYIEDAEDINNIRIIVSIDNDDPFVNPKMFQIHKCIEVIRGPSLGKIDAINRDIPDPSTFDILLLASDDMIPQIRGYDTMIRNRMREHFPDTDGVLFFNDSHQGYKLNTLVICGSKYYQRFGYVYFPGYKSLFCDNEFTDEANRLGRQIYFDDVIIKHEHWEFNEAVKDATYTKNQTFFESDKLLYNSRIFKNYDVSVLICTIPSRRHMLINLINRLNVLKRTTSLNIQVLSNNATDVSIGKKRNILVSSALGKYCCFIDDDDDITDDYFKVIEDSQLVYDCIALNGIIYRSDRQPTPFYHSLKYDHWFQDDVGYYRNPNHLNPIKTEIARQIQFPNVSHGEDHEYSKRLLESGLLITEFAHNTLQYKYMYKRPEERIIHTKPLIHRILYTKVKTQNL